MLPGLLFPKKVLIGIQEGRCNLKCPKCYTHGKNTPSENARSVGIMDMDFFVRILDECAPHRPRIAPQTWDEPLLNPRFAEYAREIKKRDLPITMDTNGLLLSESLMRDFIDIRLDSIFISLDALTSDTQTKTRGVAAIEKLSEKLHRFLELRGSRLFPRIGVSFVVEDANRRELDEFVKYWTRFVDVVRVNELFHADRTTPAVLAKARKPCWSLWDSLMIHHNGEAALCCVDTHYQNRIGNVSETGVARLWNGAFFENARKNHVGNDYRELPICASCTLWSNDEATQEKTSELLISRTSTHTYFNRVDRLESVIQGNRYIR